MKRGQPLACQINFCKHNFSSASVFKALQCCSKFVKMLSEWQTAWIWMRPQVTLCLNSDSSCLYYGTLVLIASGLRNWLTLSPPNKLSAKFLVCTIFMVLQCRPKLVKILSECQTAWIRVRRLVTRCLIWIQAVCIWHFGCASQAMG